MVQMVTLFQIRILGLSLSTTSGYDYKEKSWGVKESAFKLCLRIVVKFLLLHPANKILT